MKTLTILPAIVLGAASLALSTGVMAADTSWTDPITGVVHSTGKVLTDIGNGTVNAVGSAGRTTENVVTGGGQKATSNKHKMSHHKHHKHHMSHKNKGDMHKKTMHKKDMPKKDMQKENMPEETTHK